jgi:hypothetical protein
MKFETVIVAVGTQAEQLAEVYIRIKIDMQNYVNKALLSVSKSPAIVPALWKTLRDMKQLQVASLLSTFCRHPYHPLLFKNNRKNQAA